jgi:hypothetical protein
MPTEQEIEDRITTLAQQMRERGLATSDMQARERARGVVMNELAMMKSYADAQFDPSKNPQQRPTKVAPEVLAKSGGMLTGDELPKDIPLAELLKGRKREE